MHTGSTKPRSYAFNNINCEDFHISLLEHNHSDGVDIQDIYTRFMRSTKGMKKYKIDRRYPS